MTNPIFYVDSSAIREGKIDEVKVNMKELADFARANEPQLISYNFFIDELGARMSTVAIHADAVSMEFHIEVGTPYFRKFTDLINLESIDVYGEPSETVLAQLRQKAAMLGAGGVTIHELQSGFSRIRV
ncbi:MAG: hypothetical protein ABR548_08745 [Actinomycetota bacterium]|nr:hypothetical protein [Actinomycetota bacterium]